MIKGLTRRNFIKQASGGLLAVASFQELPPEIQIQIEALDLSVVHREGFSILQGLTTETSAQFSVDVPKDMAVHYELVDCETSKAMDLHDLQEVRRPSSNWRVDKLIFTGLSLGHEYFLNVIDQKNRLLDQRVVKPLDLKNPNPRWAMISCVLDWHPGRNAMWEGLEKVAPDFIFFMGDNVYGDIVAIADGPDLLWSRYISTRRRVAFYHWKHLVPVVAIWDDHDFGKNDADGNYPHKENSLHCFRTFNAQADVPGVLAAGPGNSYVFDAFGHRFLLLDDRYFRGVLSSGNRFWGDEQFQWIGEQSQGVNKPMWLFQGGQFFGRFLKKGAAEDFSPDELHRLTMQLRKSGGPVSFGSGDIHFAEMMRIESDQLGYETTEFTTSSMHSFPPIRDCKNPRRQFTDRRNNWLLMEQISHVAGSPAYAATYVGRHGSIYHQTQAGF